MQDAMRQILGVMDAAAAFIMLWANQRITMSAGLSTPQRRWAFARRIAYCSMATALFILGVERFTGAYESPMLESLAQIILLLGIMFFPLLRAFGLISQDVYIDGMKTDWFKSPQNLP